MTQKDTGFDAFFQAITTSPEFKSAVTKDWKWDSMDALEASLLEMQSWVDKAATMMKEFEKTYNTPEAQSAATKSNSPPPKTWDAKSEWDVPAIEVQHFVKKDDTTWGFAWVAGMEELKQELRDSFIKPLRFKFMVERMRKNSGNPVISTESRGLGTTRDLAQKNWKLEQDLSSSEGGSVSVIANEMKQSSHETNTTGSLRTSRWQEPINTELLEQLYAEYEKFRISIPTGMLFYGPPGTGKTFITRKLAEELGCGFISKNMGEFGSSYLHQTTKNIKDFFTWAKKAAENEPIILFLDEIDSLVSARTNNVDANKAEEVSQFLQEFNALESAPNLIVIAATNRPDHLDPAILRSGRLDKKIYLWPPDEIARRALFEMYIEKKWRPHEALDYDELSKLSEWYVSADIEAICDEVARDASQKLLELIDEAEAGTLPENFHENNLITMDSLRKTIAETPSSLKMVDMSIYESWIKKIK